MDQTKDVTSRIEAAIEAIRIAEALATQYIADASKLGSAMTIEGRLLALDQNYQGVWQKLTEAATLAHEAGRDTGAFDQLRAEVGDVHNGYKEEREVRIGLDLDLHERVTVSVSRKRIRQVRRALAALKQAVPEAAGPVEHDAEIEAFMAAERGGRAAKRLALSLGSGLVVVGAVVAVFMLMRPPSYGVHTQRIRGLEKKLRSKRCDKKLTVKLAEALIRAGAHEAALERAQHFFAQCGEYRRLRWATFTAYKKLGRDRAAVAEVTRLIEAVPHDWDYRWWRGEIYEKLGQFDEAAADYRQALMLNPRLRSVPFMLVSVLQRASRPCEALFWLRVHLRARPSMAQWPKTQRWLAKLSEEARCQALRGKGEAELSVAAPLQVKVSADKTQQGSFTFHEDEPLVLISTDFARRLGIATKGEALRLRARDGGLLAVKLVNVAKIEVQGAAAEQVLVAVTEKLPEGVDGVLGHSFFTRFEVQVDREQGRLRLASGT